MPDRKVQQIQSPLSMKYDNCEFTLADSLTNYDFKENVTGAYSNFDSYSTINIRTTRQITVRLNDDGNDAITVDPNRPFELDNQMLIKNIFITNASGDTASIKVFGTRKLGKDNYAT